MPLKNEPSVTYIASGGSCWLCGGHDCSAGESRLDYTRKYAQDPEWTWAPDKFGTYAMNAHALFAVYRGDERIGVFCCGCIQRAEELSESTIRYRDVPDTDYPGPGELSERKQDTSGYVSTSLCLWLALDAATS